MVNKIEIIEKKYDGFYSVKEGGKFHGLKNLMSTEISRWKRSRGWWMQLIAILLMANGLAMFTLYGAEDPIITSLMLFPLVAGFYIPLAVMTSVQSAIVAEKTEGTAIWVLSKPVSRLAFISSKLLTNMISITISMILIPFLLFYLQLILAGADANFLGTMIAAGLFWIWCMFWLTLALMLGVFLNSRISVMYVMLTVYTLLIFMVVFEMIPSIINPISFWPGTSVAPPLEGEDETDLSMMSDQITGVLTINIAPLLLIGFCIIFIIAAVRKFPRLDL